MNVRDVGRKVGARYVLEGSIQRDAEQLRVSAQLIDTHSNAHVWSDRWDRPAKDVFKVQAEVAEGVASRLAGWRGAINGADQAAAKRKRPQDLNAYDLYLLGIEAKHRLTTESTDEAITF